MTNTPNDADVNDPATQAVITRIRRMSLVSAGIMLVGVASVLGVIIYKLTSVPTATGPVVTAQVEAVAGRVISASAADGRLTVTHDLDGVATVIVYDLRTLRETHRLVVGGPAAPRR